MFEFIQRHIRIVLVAGIIIIAGMVIVLVMVSTKTNTTNVASVNNESNYEFLKADISEQDKYLMLLAKIQVENYGTYSESDPRLLWDLKNQSTSTFSTKVDQLIDSITPTTNISTTVDPNSISILDKTDFMARIKMNSTQTIGNKITKIESTVDLLKQGEYWLVDAITTSPQ